VILIKIKKHINLKNRKKTKQNNRSGFVRTKCLGLFIYFCYIKPFTLKKNLKNNTMPLLLERERYGMSSDFVQISVIIIAEKSMFKIFLP